MSLEEGSSKIKKEIIEAIPLSPDKKRINQSALAMVDRLVATSKFKRSTTENPNCQLEINEQKYNIESIEYGEHPDIEKIQKLMVDTFGQEEVDPEEVLRSAIDGKTIWGSTDATKYRVYVLKNEKGEVQSMVTGGLLDLQKDGKSTGETMFMIGYAVTSKDARQGGLAKEAYISSIIGAAQEAEAQGKKLSFTAGECTFTSEKFWNKVGWKRAYGQEGNDRGIKQELQYVQPALDFIEETGKVAKDASEVPEHLMIDSFELTEPTKEQVLQIVEAFYRWCNKWPREAFKSDEAYQTHLKYVNEIEEKFKQQLESLGELTFLSKEERELSQKVGMIIHEYKDADHGDVIQ